MEPHQFKYASVHWVLCQLQSMQGAQNRRAKSCKQLQDCCLLCFHRGAEAVAQRFLALLVSKITARLFEAGGPHRSPTAAGHDI